MLDLRSDTLTLPTEAMRAAMMAAPVGDSFYDEDPSVNALEREAAAFFGSEAALFVPSGTMGNQICLRLWCTPGQAVLAAHSNHIVQSESGALAGVNGLQVAEPPLRDGFWPDPARLAEAYVPFEAIHAPQTTLVALENTHLRSGGRTLSLAAMRELSDAARELGLRAHLDGARIWHALVREKISPENLGGLFDSMSVCFSKGLGAPVGSCILASKRDIHRAKRIRKMLGGTMRQCGFLAEAARYAVKTHYPQVIHNAHAEAQELYARLKSLFPAADMEAPETNLVFLRFGTPAEADAALHLLAERHCLKLGRLDGVTLRAVTHLSAPLATRSNGR